MPTYKNIKTTEVYLNGVPYNLTSPVRRQLISQFAPQITLGDTSYETEQQLSNLIWSDLRQGIGVEEMEKSLHANRTWWSTADNRFRGHNILPPLATLATLPTLPTIANGDLEAWTSGTDATSWTETLVASGTITREDTLIHGGTYAAKLLAPGAPDTATLSQATAGSGVFLMTLWVRSTVTGDGTVTISLSGGDTATPTNDSTYRQYKLIGTGVETVSVAADGGTTGSAVAYVDDVVIVALGTSYVYSDFNSNMYIGAGNYLLKVDTSTGTITSHKAFDNTITDLKVGVGYLYIWFGNSVSPSRMDTSDVVTLLGWTSGYYAVFMGQGFYNIDTDDGGFRQNNTAKATLTPASYGTIHGLDLYRDSDQLQTVYARTNKGLFGYDATNNLWVETELQLPTGTNTGKGCAIWRSALFLSAGLDIHKYTTGATSTIQQVGLRLDDGIPAEYDGEIVGMAQGYNSIYAFVDASQTSASTTSWIAEYTGTGWQVLWTDPDGTNKVMGSYGIESSVYARRLWFSCNGKLYYIPRQTSLLNPRKISTYTYGKAATILTPWWDGGTAVYPKLAKKLTTFQTGTTPSFSIGTPLDGYVEVTDYTALSGATLIFDVSGTSTTLTEGVDWTAATSGSATATSLTTAINTVSNISGTKYFDGLAYGTYFTADSGYKLNSVTPSDTTNLPVLCEVIYVSYRIDMTYADIDTGWTVLGSLNTSSALEFEFASSAGVVFSKIQFRFDFVRGSTSTYSPDLQSAVLAYSRYVDPRYIFTFDVSIADVYGTNTAKELETNILAAIASQVDIPLQFHDGSIHYVKLIPPTGGSTTTGKQYQGKYRIVAMETVP